MEKMDSRRKKKIQKADFFSGTIRWRRVLIAIVCLCAVLFLALAVWYYFMIIAPWRESAAALERVEAMEREYLEYQVTHQLRQ